MHVRQVRSLLIAFASFSLVAMQVGEATRADEAAPVIGRASSSALQEVQRNLGSVVAGSSFDDADAPIEFGEALERIASERASDPPAAFDSRSPSPDARHRYVAALREAARVLELTAADLEDAESFDEADELRRRARKLRLAARQSADLSSAGSIP